MVAGTLDLTRLISDQTQFLATLSVPESGGLVLLGSLLISGASLLRRKWPARHEEDE
jgi:hypothetical protein